MIRLMRDDPSRIDPLSLLTTAKIAATLDIVCPIPQYIRATGDATLTITENCVIAVGDAIFKTESGDSLTASQLDAGTFQIGRDYYIYVCDDGSSNRGEYRISLNSTFPGGFTAANSRKIGGFHFGVARRTNDRDEPINTSGVAFGAGWEANVYNGIVPKSVWTLKHRPKCTPEGMVYAGNGLWVDIYLSSSDGAGGIQSAHGIVPVTGTEGFDWYTFVERLRTIGKRLPTHTEWITAAYGAPQGLADSNDNAWSRSAAPANNARNIAGGVARAVSAIGCRDTTGNVWEWNDELVTRYDATGANAIGTFRWFDLVGAGNGQVHLNSPTQIISLISGGGWNNGVNAGSRCVHAAVQPWHVGTSVGARGVSDSL